MDTWQLGASQIRRPRQVTYDFAGANVLITGAARGQGATHALRFAEYGANLALCDLADGHLDAVPYPLGTAAELESVAEQCRALGVRVHTAVCDVRREDQVQAFVEGAVAELGGLDAAVANAGIAGIIETVDMDEATWDAMLDINLKGVFLTLKHCGRQLIAQGRGGSLIAIASVQAYGGAPGSTHYVAAKHGVVGLCKSMAIELAPHKIRVNYICPTAINAPMAAIVTAPHVPADHGERLFYYTGSWNLLDEGSPPLEPCEVTEAVLYLASDASLYVTGTPHFVDAGFLAK